MKLLVEKTPATPGLLNITPLSMITLTTENSLKVDKYKVYMTTGRKKILLVKCSQITRNPFFCKRNPGKGSLFALNTYSMSLLVALNTIA